MLVNVVILILGFVVLIKGADLLVDGASSLAKRFGISELVIGLTIVSFGTSSPELFVNLIAATSGQTDLALGNIIGSNIANTLLILGVAAMIYPLAVKRTTVWREIPLALVASFAVVFLMNDSAIDGHATSALSRADGLVLLLLFGIFLYYTYGISRVSGGEDDPDIKHRPWPQAAIMIVSGAAGLALGGKWIIDNATVLAAAAGIKESVVGLTLLAFGTSVPELATSALAAWRKNVDIAVGNVVGSNIFNLLFVLAVTSIVTPIPLPAAINIDALVMIGSSFLLFFAMFNQPRHRLERWEGIAFFVLYVGYAVHLFWR